MRNSIIGLVLAAALLGGLFALAKYDPPKGLVAATPTDAAAQIAPGYSGVQQIGAWTLGCVAGPNNHAQLKPDAFGRCRVNLAYRRKADPKQVVLVIAMRLLGPDQHLAVIVILPPIVKSGDELEMHVAQRMLKLPVTTCKDGRCVALAALGAQGEAQLLSGPGGELVFPPDQTGKRGGVAVPFAGLQPAIAAMRRAEAS
jgi:invasion protein IalB